MGVYCQILINRPREGVHKAGRLVTGVIKYAVDEPERYKDITLSLVGKGKCSWTETRTNTRKGRHKTVTYTGTEVYTSQYISIHNKGIESTFILAVGTYEYPFRFLLPNNIPSSFENSVCSIKYKLILKFERPQFFSINKTFETEINVYGYVNATSPEGRTAFGLQKTLFKPFKRRTHQVDLKIGISNVIFSPGQNAELTYAVTNNTDVIIPSLKTELICYTTYTANCGRRKYNTKIIKECTVETPSVPDNAVANVANIMPILAHLYSIQNCRIMCNEYLVKVTLRLPMPYLNASTKHPIVIGERYGVNDVERYVQEIEDEPPSYFEAMNEDKDND